MAEKYEAIKFEDGNNVAVNDHLMIEEALQININGEPFTVIMQSPGDEKELTLGLLYAEDIARKAPENYTLELGNLNKLGHITTVNVVAKEEDLGTGYKNSRSLLSVSSCGICGKRELGDLSVSGEKFSAAGQIELTQLRNLFTEMRNMQDVFKQTGVLTLLLSFRKTDACLQLKRMLGDIMPLIK